jgi:hypothetical protein
MRAEGKPNGLTPIRRGTQSIFYERSEFLRWLGIEPPATATATAPAPEPVTEPPGRRRGRPHLKTGAK